MKISQDMENGRLKYYLNSDENYDVDEHVAALSEFVSAQSVVMFRLVKVNSYRKVIGRLDELERQVEELKAKQ